MTGIQPPAVPVFYAGQPALPQLTTMAQTFTFLTNPPTFRARNTAGQALTSTTQYLAWNQVDEDDYTGWGPSQTIPLSNTIYVSQAPGWYLVTGTGSISTSSSVASGTVMLMVCAVNGNSQIGMGASGWQGQEIYPPTGTGAPHTLSSCWAVYTSLGDQIQVGMFYSSESGSLTTDTTAGLQPHVEIVWISV